MRIFKSVTHKIILLILIFVFSLNLNTKAFAGSNLSRTQIETIMDEIAMKRAIPSVILKSIGWTESKLQQFNYDGTPKISGDCIGLMMINNNSGLYDSSKLKYDIQYNIEAGVDVLLNKWSMSSYKMVSSVGNMNPDILENWYFALWAYNGWASSNNPNSLPSYVKTQTYQQLIYNVCKDQYNQKITNIDFSYLPQSGKPSRSLVVPTPSNIHTGNIVLYENGDYTRTDGVRNTYALRDVPAGKYIKEISNNQLMTVVDGPVLKNGYYWYKVYINDSIQGWIERNWLLRTGDIESGRYIFEDIAFSWARKNIMQLYNMGIISESTYYKPNEAVNKEAFCIFLSKTMKLQNSVENVTTLPYTDANKINTWALNHVINVYNAGLLESYSSIFNPAGNLTRKEAALILANIFEEDPQYNSLDINTIFKDVSTLNNIELSAVKEAYIQEFMSGKSSGEFRPDENLSRAETAAIMVKIINKIENK
ncbi:MAG: hypothetical protein K0Q97_537 [Bacillota bacterium]|nr:hypothetical protein [Bacillota bacterium]